MTRLALTNAERAAALDLLATWAEAKTAPAAFTAPDVTPMATELTRRPWQHIDGMDDLAGELAGVAAAMDLLTVWHLHAAAALAERADACAPAHPPASRGYRNAAAQRCKTALRAKTIACQSRAAAAAAKGGL